MFDLKWIMAPVVGGLIGLITNGIAIRMLFRPFHPVKIGRFTLPFTPGLIPKEQPRLARAIGRVIGDKLLDQETLKKALASDTLHAAFENKVERVLESWSRQTCTVHEYLEKNGWHAPADAAVQSIGKSVSAYVAESIVSRKLGGTILEYAVQEVLANLNSMVAMVAEPAIRKAQPAIAERIDQTIAEQCPAILEEYIGKEYGKWMDKPMREAAAMLWTKKDLFQEKVWALYLELLEKKAGRFLERLDVSAVVEQKINEFDMRELEDLIMEISRKELNALVWIGGLLGAVIGMVNLLF